MPDRIEETAVRIIRHLGLPIHNARVKCVADDLRELYALHAAELNHLRWRYRLYEDFSPNCEDAVAAKEGKN